MTQCFHGMNHAAWSSFKNCRDYRVTSCRLRDTIPGMGTVPVGQTDFKRRGGAAGRGIAVGRIVVFAVIYVMVVVDRPAVERYRELEPDVRDALAVRPGLGQYLYPVEEQVHEIALLVAWIE